MKKEEKKSTNFGWSLNGDRVAIKRVDEEKISKGGIIIPDIAQEKANEGIIVALGDDIIEDESGLRKSNVKWYIGQKIKFGKYAGSEVTGDDGEEYLIMRENDLLAYRKK